MGRDLYASLGMLLGAGLMFAGMCIAAMHHVPPGIIILLLMGPFIWCLAFSFKE